MFANLPVPAEDKILGLMRRFREDPRDNKMDLSVGVYADEKGQTIILDVVKEAEKRLLAKQTTKTYVGLAGDPTFNRAMQEIVFGEGSSEQLIRGVQAPGGSGSLRLIAELLGRHRPDSHIWLSTPTWPNHQALLNTAEMPVSHYPYFDPETKSVDFAAMKATLSQLGPNDVVILHGCCHNPTGANLTKAQWDEVAQIAHDTGFFPFVDLAYQGFGDNLEEDAYGTRKLADTVAEMAVAVSCSKNFGIYRERVGCALIKAGNEQDADVTFKQLQSIGRSIYSMPPDHGAAVVSIIWHDPELRQRWFDELNAITARMLNLRQSLADNLRAKLGTDQFDFLAEHRGMFSLLGITAEQVEALREKHGIYIVGDGRMNIAGLQEERVEEFAAALADVIS
ncbi:MAG: aromatic amino acid transaminase [Thiolinea sp.]